jgi:hypothetical protein
VRCMCAGLRRGRALRACRWQAIECEKACLMERTRQDNFVAVLDRQQLRKHAQGKHEDADKAVQAAFESRMVEGGAVALMQASDKLRTATEELERHKKAEADARERLRSNVTAPLAAD